MRRAPILGLAALASLAAVGCDKKADDQEAVPTVASTSAASATNAAPKESAVASAAPSAAPAASVALAFDAGAVNDAQVASVPAEEDFEAKAEAAINRANAEAELKKLEKEFGK